MQITILFRVVAVAVFLHTFTASEILVTGILNRQSGSCAQDDDCSSRETFLYCINRQCQCLQGGSSYVHGVLLQFNMEWDPYQTKCVSKPGSPCTFKNRWYSSSETAKLDCVPDSTCIPHASSSSANAKQYPQHDYHQQQSRFQQPENSMTPADFGVCWQNRQGSVDSNVDKTPFYPILTPNQQPQYHQPGRHEFVGHGNGYPISPTKVDNSATKYSSRNGLFVFCIILAGLWVAFKK